MTGAPALPQGPFLPAGQVTTQRPDGSTVISGSRLLHEGARGALVVAPGIFRLDLSTLGDSVRIVVRPLGPGTLHTRGSGYGSPVFAASNLVDERVLTVGRHELGFVLADQGRATDVEVTVATARERERGLVHCSCMATVRPGA